VETDGRLRVAMTVEQCWQPVPGGSGTYIRELVREYAAMPEVEVTGVTAWHRRGAPPGGPLDLPLRRLPLPRPALYAAWERARRPRVGRGQDVVHATTWALPGRRVPLVVTVHDLAFLHDPGHFTQRGVAFFRRALDITRDEAAAVVVPSQATRDECVAAGIDGDRITVVPHGVRPAATTPDQVAEFRGRFGLERPYVMWAGTREPRKNLPTLLAAFTRVLRSGADLDLVLVGPDGWGPGKDRLTRTEEERVRLLGRVPAADLAAAYAGAAVFCYPSLREGYGMPVTEAMAHGVPVVTSRGTATEEAAGGAALLVDPRDAEELAGALLTACEPARAAELAAASARRAAGLSWAASARATAAVLRRAAQDGPRR
jgi:glycosyltransferase involved in cell wall biosynthesis